MYSDVIVLLAALMGIVSGIILHRWGKVSERAKILAIILAVIAGTLLTLNP